MRENSTELRRSWNMKRMFQLVVFGCLIFLSSRAAAYSIQSPLLADVDMNKRAGRGSDLIVPFQLESGETARFILDTGSSTSLIDKSLEPKLGKRLGSTTISMFGKNKQKSGIYAAPKLYLEKVRLMTGDKIHTNDFKPQRTHVMGLLGMDCLKHYCIQLDFQAGKVRFLDSAHLNVDNLGKAYPITISRWGRPFILHNSLIGEVKTNTPVTTRELPPTYALIDSGYFADGRVDTGTNVAGDPTWIHLSECVWDGETYTNIAVGHGENANIIGLKFLARHLVTLGFPQRTMYLKQTSVGPLKK
ncbi:MAG: aspartyl protease family protein [Limisphaerales bacterium]